MGQRGGGLPGGYPVAPPAGLATYATPTGFVVAIRASVLWRLGAWIAAALGVGAGGVGVAAGGSFEGACVTLVTFNRNRAPE